MKAVDVGAVLDEGHWGGYQKLLVFATALTIILDGVDNQLLGVAIPVLMSEWGVARGAFAPVLASGLVGMMIGGAIAGVLGDRFGRRVALLGSVFLFGILTCAIVFVNDVFMLGVVRFFAGLGLGGAMPNATALASEYVPRRHRPFAVTLTVVCIPLGGTLAGLVGAQILPQFGWRVLFGVGGVLPLVLGLVLLRALPESPRYLARRRERWPELASLLGRLGHHVPVDASFSDSAEALARTSVRELFVPEYRRDTLALFASFFFCLLAAYAGVSWLPTMLTGAGVALNAGLGLAAFNIGGVIGAIIGAPIIGRLGSRVTMLTMCAGAVTGAAVVAATPIATQPALVVLALLAWTGGLINATQTTMFALAAHVYPTAVRATGVGAVAAFGRIGSVLSSYAGAWALESGGASRFFMLLAVMMALVFISLAAVRHHIPRVASRGRGAYLDVQPVGR